MAKCRPIGAVTCLTNVGTGTLTLSGSSNTYTGPTTVSAGVLAYGANNAETQEK
jgi:autotransporter-associated beta strand protein